MAALLHLIAHAAIKSTLFLGAGVFQHDRDSTDMEAVAGAGRARPLVLSAFAVAALALAGIPPLAGFFSKDAILAAALAAPGVVWLAPLALAGTVLTGAYMARALRVLWQGEAQPVEVAKQLHTEALQHDDMVLLEAISQSNPAWNPTSEFILLDYISLTDQMQVIFETSDGDTFDLGVALGRTTPTAGSRIAGGFNTASLGTSLGRPLSLIMRRAESPRGVALRLRPVAPPVPAIPL